MRACENLVSHSRPLRFSFALNELLLSNAISRLSLTFIAMLAKSGDLCPLWLLPNFSQLTSVYSLMAHTSLSLCVSFVVRRSFQNFCYTLVKLRTIVWTIVSSHVITLMEFSLSALWSVAFLCSYEFMCLVCMVGFVSWVQGRRRLLLRSLTFKKLLVQFLVASWKR